MHVGVSPDVTLSLADTDRVALADVLGEKDPIEVDTSAALDDKVILSV